MIYSCDVESHARTFLSVRFKHQGRSKKSGVDCIGLAVCVLSELGLPIVDITNYARKPNPQMMGESIEPYLLQIPKTDIVAGCILWMQFAKEPMHIAIVTGLGMIHAYEPIGRVVEHNIDAKWNRRIYRAYKMVLIPCT